MRLLDLLAKKRSAIIAKWRDAIIETYSPDMQRFIRREKDQFSNPVGFVIRSEIETLYDAVTLGRDSDKIGPSLNAIIRLRAVQDFSPSQAVAFVLQLKRLIREAIRGETLENGNAGDLEALENRIDEITLEAFDIYAQCRRKLHEIRVKEVRNEVGRLLERANLRGEIREGEPDLRR